MLLKTLIILGEVRSKISPNFMIIKITFPNSLSVVFSFSFSHELLMSFVELSQFCTCASTFKQEMSSPTTTLFEVTHEP